jgi:hypothetical protein
MKTVAKTLPEHNWGGMCMDAQTYRAATGTVLQHETYSCLGDVPGGLQLVS